VRGGRARLPPRPQEEDRDRRHDGEVDELPGDARREGERGRLARDEIGHGGGAERETRGAHREPRGADERGDGDDLQDGQPSHLVLAGVEAEQRDVEREGRRRDERQQVAEVDARPVARREDEQPADGGERDGVVKPVTKADFEAVV
jgi:hypothetical protein